MQAAQGPGVSVGIPTDRQGSGKGTGRGQGRASTVLGQTRSPPRRDRVQEPPHRSRLSTPRPGTHSGTRLRHHGEDARSFPELTADRQGGACPVRPQATPPPPGWPRDATGGPSDLKRFPFQRGSPHPRNPHPSPQDGDRQLELLGQTPGIVLVHMRVLEGNGEGTVTPVRTLPPPEHRLCPCRRIGLRAPLPLRRRFSPSGRGPRL